MHRLPEALCLRVEHIGNVTDKNKRRQRAVACVGGFQLPGDIAFHFSSSESSKDTLLASFCPNFGVNLPHRSSSINDTDLNPVEGIYESEKKIILCNEVALFSCKFSAAIMLMLMASIFKFIIYNKNK